MFRRAVACLGHLAAAARCWVAGDGVVVVAGGVDAAVEVDGVVDGAATAAAVMETVGAESGQRTRCSRWR